MDKVDYEENSDNEDQSIKKAGTKRQITNKNSYPAGSAHT